MFVFVLVWSDLGPGADGAGLARSHAATGCTGRPGLEMEAEEALIPDLLDIYRTANVLIKQQGEDAPIHAAMRAVAMLDKGELDGYVVWQRVLKAVGDLWREGPVEGERAN